MADPTANGEEELVDYEEEEVVAEADAAAGKGEQVKKGYVGIHSSGFKDFLLKPELIRAIVDCGFEHPSEGAGRLRHRDTSAARQPRFGCAPAPQLLHRRRTARLAAAITPWRW